MTNSLSSQLMVLKEAIEVEEEYPFSNEIGYLPPSFISGLCPQCKESMSGFTCEKCGLTYQPEQIIEKSSKIFVGNISAKKVKNLFFHVNKKRLMSELNSISAKAEALKIVEKYCDETKKIRLTLPIEWGVKASNNLTYYSRGTFFPYCLLLAKICQKEHELISLPFSANSDVETVGSFGFDNITTFMADTLNHANALEGYKGFNHYIPNKFMTLNGSKFSTSRNHAVWVDKLPSKIEIDILRLFLLKNNSDENENDFNINEFVRFYNQMALFFNEKIGKKSISNQSKNNSKLFQMNSSFEILIGERITYLMPENYDANKIYSDVMSWFELYDEKFSKNDFYIWLRCLSIVIYPVMPNISLRLWNALYLEGMPEPKDFNSDVKDLRPIHFSPLNLINAIDIEVG